VSCDDGGADDGLAVLVSNSTLEGRSGDLRKRRHARNQRSESEQKAFESVFHKGLVEKNKY
jgi:hypothetical protein